MGFIAHIETGRKLPGAKLADRLARILNLNRDTLLRACADARAEQWRQRAERRESFAPQPEPVPLDKETAEEIGQHFVRISDLLIRNPSKRRPVLNLLRSLEELLAA